MQTIGTSRANEDGYVVREYLDSRDAMALLDKTGETTRDARQSQNGIRFEIPTSVRERQRRAPVLFL